MLFHLAVIALQTLVLCAFFYAVLVLVVVGSALLNT